MLQWIPSTVFPLIKIVSLLYIQDILSLTEYIIYYQDLGLMSVWNWISLVNNDSLVPRSKTIQKWFAIQSDSAIIIFSAILQRISNRYWIPKSIAYSVYAMQSRVGRWCKNHGAEGLKCLLSKKICLWKSAWLIELHSFKK